MSGIKTSETRTRTLTAEVVRIGWTWRRPFRWSSVTLKCTDKLRTAQETLPQHYDGRIVVLASNDKLELSLSSTFTWETPE